MILLHKNSGQHAGMEKGYRHFVITYGMVRSAKNDLTGKIRKTLHIGNSIPTSYFVSKQEIHWYSVSSSRLIMNFIFILWINLESGNVSYRLLRPTGLILLVNRVDKISVPESKKRHWDKRQTKEITIWKNISSLFVLSHRVSCSSAWLLLLPRD